MAKWIIACACVIASVAGCTPRHIITGEPVVFRADPLTGQITDRDIVNADSGTPLGTIPHKDEIITLVVNNVFVRHAEKLLDRHLMVYAEVYDDGTDDPS